MVSIYDEAIVPKKDDLKKQELQEKLQEKLLKHRGYIGDSPHIGLIRQAEKRITSGSTVRITRIKAGGAVWTLGTHGYQDNLVCGYVITTEAHSWTLVERCQF